MSIRGRQTSFVVFEEAGNYRPINIYWEQAVVPSPMFIMTSNDDITWEYKVFTLPPVSPKAHTDGFSFLKNIKPIKDARTSNKSNKS